jgi:glutathione-regulated potassium-efflux system ancillary protein KefG
VSVPILKKILVLFAHPRQSTSVVQRVMLDAIEGLDGVTIHDLYASYPDFLIDVRREQALLSAHDIIVLQHPFYWYSAPSIIKEWFDLVLEHGWAYGAGGLQLSGKFLMSALSTGGAKEAYCASGHNRFEIGEMLIPFNQTAHLCGMGWLKPFVIHSGRNLEPAALSGLGEAYRDLIVDLRDARKDPLKYLAQGYSLPKSFTKIPTGQESKHAS